MFLQNLYGSSHSYLQNLCDGSDCNQQPWLQNLDAHHHHPMFHGLQQDMDSKHDLFQTQNIGIKKIESLGNVDISLQNLYGSSHSYLQNLYGSSHSYLQNLCDGSDCNQMFLQNLCDGSDCNQMGFLQNLEATTTMYLVKDDVCNQTQIHDSFTGAAQAHGLVAGACAHNGWTVKGKSFEQKV